VSRASDVPRRFEPSLLDALDEPVRRYLRHALRTGAELAPGVRLAMSGRIRTGVWLPFTARQESDGRSFAWRARVGLGRITLLTVVDRFANGAGRTEGRLLGRRLMFHAEGETRRARPPAGPRWRASSHR
jgi:hypothetical protein